MITPANRAIELKTPLRFQGEAGGGDPTKRKVKLRPPIKNTEKPVEKQKKVDPPTRSQSVNGQDVSQTGYFIDPMKKIFVEDVPTQGINEKITDYVKNAPNLSPNTSAQNLYPSEQDQVLNSQPKQPDISKPEKPIENILQGLDDTFVNWLKGTQKVADGVTELSPTKFLQGSLEQATNVGNLVGQGFTIADELVKQIPDIGQFVSGIGGLPFKLIGEGVTYVKEKTHNLLDYLGVSPKVQNLGFSDETAKKLETSLDNFNQVAAQFVIPLGIEGIGKYKKGLETIKGKLDVLPEEIKTPENIQKIIDTETKLLSEGQKFTNTVSPEGVVTRKEIPTGDLTSTTEWDILKSKTNIKGKPNFF